MNEPTRTRWSLPKAFLTGAAIGAAIGALASWVDYGAFDTGYMFNHVLGGLFIVGVAFLGLAALINWRRRNPL